MLQIRQQYFLTGAVLVAVVPVAAVVMETVAEGVEEAFFRCLHCVVLDITAVVVTPGEVVLVPVSLVVVGRAVETKGVGVDMPLTLAWRLCPDILQRYTVCGCCGGGGGDVGQSCAAGR